MENSRFEQVVDRLLWAHKIETDTKAEHRTGKIIPGILLLGAACLLGYELGMVDFTDLSRPVNGMNTGIKSSSVPWSDAETKAGKRELPIYSVDTGQKVVALSFDAAWGNEDTALILEILKEEEVPATFFLTGNWVEDYPEDVIAIADAGHDLGNHSATHPHMTELTDSEKKEEIRSVHDAVYALTGKEMCLFRPPYGDYDSAVVKSAAECGYYTIQWSVDSLDWKGISADTIVKNIVNHRAIDSGAIILMHNGGEHTAEALPELIRELKESGYGFVGISDLIYRDHFYMDSTGCQHSKDMSVE